PKGDTHGFRNAIKIRLISERVVSFAFVLRITPIVVPLITVVVLESEPFDSPQDFLAAAARQRIVIRTGRIAPPPQAQPARRGSRRHEVTHLAEIAFVCPSRFVVCVAKSRLSASISPSIRSIP